MIKYTFTIMEGGTERAVTPIYKDDASIDLERESGQMFYRAKWNGKLTFLNEDYDFIMAQPFDTKFLLNIYKQNAYNEPTELYHTMKFVITDCEIDEDNKAVIVQPTIIDEYTDTLAGIDKEFNVTELAIATDSIDITKRPLIQLYIMGENKISCFLGETYWEQDCAVITDSNLLVQTYKFKLNALAISVQIKGAGKYDGLYVGKHTQSINLDNVTIVLKCTADPNYSVIYRKTANWIDVELRDENITTTPMYGYTGNTTDPYNANYTLTRRYTAAPTASCEGSQSGFIVFSRLLTDVLAIDATATSPIPTDDISGDNRNYTRVIGIAYDVAYISNNTSNEPTQYGKNENGDYYLPPTTDKFFPIARSYWKNASLWFHHQVPTDYIIDQTARKKYTLKDAYQLSSVIKALLQQIAPDISHEGTAEYSQFLYGENPITFTNYRLFITQKSNLLIGEYQDPARNAPATLKMITDMLANALRCYWYIEDGKFKIEHIKFFENGGSYTYQPNIGIDLTEIQNIRNGKEWAFGTTKYQFNKDQMPARYQFGWMDEVTEPFRGKPINVLSNLAQEEKVEDINIGNFTTDLDYILLNPSDISKDGFALMCGEPAEGLADPQEGKPLPTSVHGEGEGLVSGTPRTMLTGQIQGKVKFKYRATGTALLLYITPALNGQALAGYRIDLQKDGNEHEVEFEVNEPFDEIMIIGITGEFYVIPYSLKLYDRYGVPFYEYTIDGYTFALQNGFLSMRYIHTNYWRYNMPASAIEVNGNAMQSASVMKGKKQQINFPVGMEDFNPLQLVKTHIGNGQIEKLSINLASRSGKATIQYATE